MRKISYLKEKLILTVSYLAVIALLYCLDVPCLFLSFLKIPCPGCGMTRALLAILRLDIAGAFAAHPMVWSLPILYAYFLLDNGLFPGKKANKIILIMIGIGFAAQWVSKLVKF